MSNVSELNRSKIHTAIYLGSRITAGTLLVLAGLSKVSPMLVIAVTSWLVIPAPAVALLGTAEFILGCLCLSLRPNRWIHRITIGCFSVFVLVLLLQWNDGEVRCQCLGSVSVPLLWMFVVDGVLLSTFILLRSFWYSSWHGKSLIAEQVHNLKFAVPGVLLSFMLWFGSINSAYAFFSGQRLMVDSAFKYAGAVVEGESIEVVFHLHNYSSKDVQILGAVSSCSCVGILDLPLNVKAGRSANLRVQLVGGRAKRRQTEGVELIFDDTTAKQRLIASAIVVEKK